MDPRRTEQAIEHKLRQAFSPQELKVRDDSARHAGHASARPGGETHFHIRIVAAAFKGKSRIERHRMIYEALAEELRGGVHALAITALSEDERF